ncbi:MAG: C45 family autoproteolytic acyltransferase/hydrolase [Promethearchaeota archaeon]
MKKVQKILALSIFITILSISISINVVPVNACYNSSEFEEYAYWKDSHGQKYLEIKANDYYSLGCFEGIELADKILTMKASIEALFSGYGIPYDYLRDLANLYKPYIPEDYITEMQGMADVLDFQGIIFDDILLQNCFIDIYYGQLVPQLSGSPRPPLEIGCTGMASKNKDGSVTIGQNFDFSQFLHPTLSFVLHQIKGKPAIFSLRMGGMLGLPMGKNSKGIISTVNVVETIIIGSIDVPSTSRTRLGFENSKSAEEFFDYLNISTLPVSYNSIYADKKSNVIGTQNIPNLSLKEEIEVGEFLVRSNTYITEEFKPYLLDPSYSVNRQNKAEELVGESFVDEKLSLYELINILQYKDNTDASICRIGSIDPVETQTGAFMACRQFRIFGFGIFGLGNALESNWGIIPI